MTYARNISTALKSHPAQLCSCFASLPPTTGEEGGGNPRSCSRRSETDAPLMQAGPHAGMILRTQSMPIDMGNKFFIWRNGPNIKDDISHYQESCLLCWQLAFISQQRLASTDLSSFPSWKGRFIKRNSVGISVEFGLSGGWMAMVSMLRNNLYIHIWCFSTFIQIWCSNLERPKFPHKLSKRTLKSGPFQI